MDITTDIGATTPDSIHVRGLDLAEEILGHFDFVDMICWLAWARRPQPREKDMLNLLLATAADHGLTPSAISARMTFLGAPEFLQVAVAVVLRRYRVAIPGGACSPVDPALHTTAEEDVRTREQTTSKAQKQANGDGLQRSGAS